MRLDKFLADRNFGTRKSCKQLILKLKVKVNGALTTKNDMNITSNDIIEVNDKIVENDPIVTIMLNKPSGYICSLNDEGYISAMKLIPPIYQKRVRMIGRLDVDTTGLLLLTSNGILNSRLASPKYHIPKKYLVKVNHLLKPELVKIFKEGNIDIGRNEFVTSAELDIIDDYSCYITIYEGKYHEIKRLFGKYFYDVISLKRVSFGQLDLDVEEGKYRLLNEKEYDILLESVSLKDKENK